jgi:hypothetical protein
LAIQSSGDIGRQIEYLKQILAQKEDNFREKIEKLIR